MGIDIHGVLQVSDTPGQWIDVVADIDCGTNYGVFVNFFAVLSGVRSGCGSALMPLSDPRGLPVDFPVRDGEYHATRQREVWMGDYGYSWLSSDEILAAAHGAPTAEFVAALERLRKDHAAVRFVFGFS